MPCTRVVFGVRAKLRSGFHFISGLPSTILLWSVMDFLPPSRYRLSSSPNRVLYTRGWTTLGGGGSRQDRYSTWDTFVFILFFLVFSSLFFFPFATRLVLDRLARRAPRLENPKRKCFRFVREAGIILSRVYWLAFIPRNFFLRFCKLYPMKIRFISGRRFLFRDCTEWIFAAPLC